jgi:uncharacterized protein
MKYQQLSDRILKSTQIFYDDNPQIQCSHGWHHACAVFRHACRAVACLDHGDDSTTETTTTTTRTTTKLSDKQAMEIQMAALLHDVDDHKYFPTTNNDNNFENARRILKQAAAEMDTDSIESILYMISLVSCSRNGNSIPRHIMEEQSFHWLIPRWSDRVEAVGKIGVVRCYQYNNEHGHALCSPTSPKPTTVEEVWALVTPERFENYQRTGHSDDMISHYYDKLLHICQPPNKDVVRNSYLEQALEESSRELVELCLRYGKTGKVDEDYIQQLTAELNTCLL